MCCSSRHPCGYCRGRHVFVLDGASQFSTTAQGQIHRETFFACSSPAEGGHLVQQNVGVIPRRLTMPRRNRPALDLSHKMVDNTP